MLTLVCGHAHCIFWGVQDACEKLVDLYERYNFAGCERHPGFAQLREESQPLQGTIANPGKRKIIANDASETSFESC